MGSDTPIANSVANVLVVEDDRRFAAVLRRRMEEEHFMVHVAYDGEAALQAVRERYFDVIVLDVLLPGVDGFEVCRHLRQEEQQVPVVMMTALGSVDDRVQGLSLGADDYIVKPFSLRELVARIHAILHRARGPASTFLSAGGLHIDLMARRAWRGQAILELSPREFDVLVLFVKHPGIVLTRQTILAAVWGAGASVSVNIVNQYVAHLRKKIDQPFDCSSLETIHGVGWRLQPLEVAGCLSGSG